MPVKFSYFFEYISRTSTFGQNAEYQVVHKGKPVRTHWSGPGRSPCPLENVANPRFFFSTGVNETITLVSVREAFFERT